MQGGGGAAIRQGVAAFVVCFGPSEHGRPGWGGPFFLAHVLHENGRSAREPMPGPIVLVHLSDIHFQKWRLDGSSYDVDKTVRDEIENDVSAECRQLGSVSGIVVTGDIAYAADPREYKAATSWLATLTDKIGCDPDAVWTAPGNHDVDRRATDTRHVSLVQKDLRADPLQLAALLADPSCAEALFRPIKEYNDFAAIFECDFKPKELVWKYPLQLNDGSMLTLLGLHSALTSSRLDDDKQHINLVLGDISPFLPRTDGVTYLSLCHHPPPLFVDSDAAEGLFTSRVHVQLFGHKHSQRILRIGDTLRIVAGATHPDRKEKNWEPRYNILSIQVSGAADARQLDVTVLARVWNPTQMKFVGDTTNNGTNRTLFSLPLSPWTRPDSPRAESSFAPSTTSHASLPKGSPMDPARRLTYRYLTLPHNKRISVAAKLDLIGDDDAELPDRALFVRIFERAQEGSKLEALWTEVERCHGDTSSTPNPFEGH